MEMIPPARPARGIANPTQDCILGVPTGLIDRLNAWGPQAIGSDTAMLEDGIAVSSGVTNSAG